MGGSGGAAASTGGSGGAAASTGGRASDPEGGAGGKPVSALDCSELRDAWNAFIQSNNECSVDADCTVFETGDLSFVCDAPAGIRAVLGPSANGKETAYAERYSSLHCGGDSTTHEPGTWTDYPFDGSPLLDPGCASGRCTARVESCNVLPPDGGP